MGIEIIPYADHHFDGVDALWRDAFPDDAPRNAAQSVIPVKLDGSAGPPAGRNGGRTCYRVSAGRL